MLQYERIDVSKDIDLNKLYKSKECMICHYWHFKDNGYNYEPYVCNGCHDLSMMAYELKSIAILNVKGVDCRCVLWNMTKNDAINLLNNSWLDNERSIIMDFGANNTPVEIIKEGAFGGTYFRDIHSGINGKWYRKSWKEFNVLNILIKIIIAQIIMKLVLINMVSSVEHH